MPVLFDGLLPLTHGQAHLLSAEDQEFTGHTEATAGQTNGLCGAAIAGQLYLTIGTDTGDVPFRIELCDSEPMVDAALAGDGESWQDIVEVSFRPETGVIALVSSEGETEDFPLEITHYRVRFSARGMDAAAIDDTVPPGEATRDRYALELWPAPAAPDVIVRTTTRAAAAWHNEARLTAEERLARD